MSLLAETMEAINDSGHSNMDIKFIGSEDGKYSCSWGEFKELAQLEYDSGYGAQHIATDLVIVFEDGQIMKRGEYDGSEWWEYTKPFVMPTSGTEQIKSLGGSHIMWTTLEGINKLTLNHLECKELL